MTDQLLRTDRETGLLEQLVQMVNRKDLDPHTAAERLVKDAEEVLSQTLVSLARDTR